MPLSVPAKAVAKKAVAKVPLKARKQNDTNDNGKYSAGKE